MTIIVLNIALDICSLLIILITTYGAFIETRENTLKNKIFKLIVGVNLSCILIDLISYIFVFLTPGGRGWYVASFIAALPPFLWVALVFFYMLSTIKEQRPISWNLGKVFAGIDALAVLIGFYFFFNGDAFSWQDNHFVPGVIGPIVFIFNVIFVIYYGSICFYYRRILGWPRSIALFMYIFIPMIGLIIDSCFIGVYSLLFCMTISVLLCFMMIQHREILNANRAKTVFLNNMSHDIRTPMNAILGFSELIGQDPGNKEAIAAYVEKIKISGTYMLGLINNVLDMARIDSGKTEIEKKCDDVTQTSNWVLSVFSEAAKQKNQSLTVSVDVQHNYVMIDSMKMQQITANLISNAIKYTPEGGHIEVFLRELPVVTENNLHYYRFVVKDDGIGMSPEYAEHVFDQFSRERNSTESKILGTGLGMAIVKKLVTLMGGKITVKSKQGRGTTFTIDTPLEVVENPEIPTQEEEHPIAKKTRKRKNRILLAEDNDLNAEIVSLMLQKEGLIVERAQDGAECVKMLTEATESHYTLILMDVQMPKLNGYEAARQIRALTGTRKSAIPIIALTANVFEEDKRLAREAGMNNHLAKPIDSENLQKVIAAYLF